MRIAMAVLADAANVRESLMNVLSAGVSQLARDAYPAPMGVDLALMFEVPEKDAIRGGTIEIDVRVLDTNEEKTIVAVEGEIGWNPNPQAKGSMYISTPVSLRDVTLPAPGEYECRVHIGGTDPIAMGLTAKPAG